MNNDGDHSVREKSGQVVLAEGYHPLHVEYFQAGADLALEVLIEGPGLSKQIVSAEMLGHQ